MPQFIIGILICALVLPIPIVEADSNNVEKCEWVREDKDARFFVTHNVQEAPRDNWVEVTGEALDIICHYYHIAQRPLQTCGHVASVISVCAGYLDAGIVQACGFTTTATIRVLNFICGDPPTPAR